MLQKRKACFCRAKQRLRRPVFISAHLRHIYQKQKRCKSNHKRSEIHRYDRVHPKKRKQRRCKYRIQNRNQRLGKRPHAAGSLIILFRDNQSHGTIPGRLLYSIHQTIDRIQQIQMPRHQQIPSQQHKNQHSTARRSRIAGQHGSFLVPPVTERARKYAHYDIRGI